MAQHRSHYWEKIADNWNHVGFPLRPCPRDTEGYSTLLNLDQQSEMTALILGVTPELYHLDWPSGTEVHSCDRSLQMIEAIWPGKRQNAIQGDWLDLRFHERFHCVLCDGGLTLLSHPDGVRELSAVLRNALIPRGKFVTRVFAKTEPHESPENVFEEIHGIANVHLFKLRLAMALQQSPDEGIVLESVYRTIIDHYNTLDQLQSETGWPHPEVMTLMSYQNSKNRYRFASVKESIDVLTSTGHLVFESLVENDYPLGERCPTLLFKRV